MPEEISNNELLKWGLQYYSAISCEVISRLQSQTKLYRDRISDIGKGKLYMTAENAVFSSKTGNVEVEKNSFCGILLSRLLAEQMNLKISFNPN